MARKYDEEKIARVKRKLVEAPRIAKLERGAVTRIAEEEGMPAPTVWSIHYGTLHADVQPA